MLNALAKLPVKSRKPIAGGLVYAALMAGLFGLLALGAFSESTEEKCTGHLTWKKCKDIELPMSERLPWLIGSVILLVFTAFCLVVAWRLFTMQGHLKRYQAILKGVETMSIQQLAGITNTRPAKVRQEVQSLISSGEIDDFYVDYSTDVVISKKFTPDRSHKTVVKCSECGGHNDLIVGITKVCSFCGQPLLLRSV